MKIKEKMMESMIANMSKQEKQEMMGSMNKKNELGTLATPEIQGMFEEWVQQINDEILEFLKENPSAGINQIAEHLKITEQSAIYFVFKLAQKDKITLEVKKTCRKKVIASL